LHEGTGGYQKGPHSCFAISSSILADSGGWWQLGYSALRSVTLQMTSLDYRVILLQHASCEFPFINVRSGLLLVAVSDYYQLDDLLTDEEKALRKKVRGIMEKEIAPIMTEVSSCKKTATNLSDFSHVRE
jgi:hypothetical protein